MEITDNEIVELLEPLTHKRIGKINYTPEVFEKYWFVFATFQLVSDPDIQTRKELPHFYANALYNQKRKWYLSRGKIQSVSYKCNRIDENYRKVLKAFRTQTNVQWVWEVKADSNWGDTLGYVVSTGDESAALSVAKMMYHTALEVAVIRTRPLFNVSQFLQRQQSAQKKIQKKIDRLREAIDDHNKQIEKLEARMCDAVTNSVCFSGE